MLTYFPEPTTKVNNIEDYDSAFEDESVTGEEKESCSRTTPNNHKSIRKWRQHSHPGGIKNNSTNIKNGHKLIDRHQVFVPRVVALDLNMFNIPTGGYLD